MMIDLPRMEHYSFVWMYVRSRDSWQVVHKVRAKSRITPQCIGQGYRLDHFNAKINYVVHCWIISTNKLSLLSWLLQKSL